MELSSLSFIFVFLPIYVFVVNISKNNKYILLGFSLLFYALCDIKYLLLLIAMILVTYLVGRRVKGNKLLYALYLIIVSSMIMLFKYGNLLLEIINKADLISFILPIGISYYTFESISYVSDVYRGKYESSSLLKVALYVSFFPTILSGPIIRFDGFDKWLNEERNNKYDDVAKGLRIFIIGLGKKILLANQLYVVVKDCFGQPSMLTVPMAWVGLFSFALRLYFDFSGCSDMAIGIGKMIGYEIPKNFDEPYRSTSVSEFFRRWHISLGSWFKDYVYIPLGGNRVSTIKWIRNILIVWLLTGIWHGSNLNFIMWGLFLGVVIVFEKLVISKIKLPTWFKWFYTTGAILLSWLMFNTKSIMDFLRYGKSLVLGGFFQISTFYPYLVLCIVGIIFISPIGTKFKKIEDKCPILYDIILLIILVASVLLIVSGSLTTSMYANF